jgi:hypothetical protein
VLTHAAWAAIPGLVHGFLDREECAGVERWETALARAGVTLPVVTARQVHGSGVLVAGGPETVATEADAVVTGAGGIAVGVVTADCVPVLLADREHRCAAAVHAGWRGAAAGVLEAAIMRLRDRFDVAPESLEAVIGPAVGPCCYAVGPEVSDAFRARTGETTAAAWSRRDGTLHVDLRAAVRSLLAAAGVTTAAIVGPCTACDRRFCSYRRDGAGCGRQLSFIGWA